jgi:hypothetical protein
MADQKKSVILYCDTIHTVEKLDDETAGQLFKHYLRYVNDKDPVAPNMIVELVFEPWKQQLKRDLSKWDHKKEVRSAAGKASAAARAKIKAESKKTTNPTSVKSVKQTPTNPTVNGIVNVNVNVNGIVINKRKAEFENSLLAFKEKYSTEMLNNFFEYWSEHGIKDKKMRFEKEKSFGLGRRLSTWSKRQIDFNKGKTPTGTASQAWRDLIQKN